MTAEEWDACADPQVMLGALADLASERKLRLFAVARCRRLDRLLLPEYRAAVDLAERYADGASGREEVARVWDSLGGGISFAEGLESHMQAAASFVLWHKTFGDTSAAHFAAGGCLSAANDAESEAAALVGGEQAGRATCESLAPIEVALVHEHFGNPFRPVAFDPAWRTSDVMLLARGIYDGRAFDRMPILADALQDAGCDNADILGHCRGTNTPHARGCWVVDLVLDKA